MVLKKRADGVITGSGLGHWDAMVDIHRRTRTVVFPFVQGTTFLSAGAAAQGWEIDAAAEYAIAFGHVPADFNAFVSLKVYAVTLVLEADEMRLELEAYGAASDEIFSTETIAVADKDSETTDMAANDVVYWKYTTTDDADLGDLAAGDSLQIKVLHEAAGDGSCATDAVFRYALLEYTIDA